MKARLDGGRLVIVPETHGEANQLLFWTEGVPLFHAVGFSRVARYFQIDLEGVMGQRPPLITLEDTIERRVEQGAGKAEAFQEIERVRYGSKRK